MSIWQDGPPPGPGDWWVRVGEHTLTVHLTESDFNGGLDYQGAEQHAHVDMPSTPPLDPDVCSVCGGQSVQVAVWADPNTGETFDDFGSWDEEDTKWCSDCDAHNLLVPLSQYDGTVGCTDCDKRVPLGEEHRPHDFCPVCNDCFEAHYDKDDPETVAADIERDRRKDGYYDEED